MLIRAFLKDEMAETPGVHREVHSRMTNPSLARGEPTCSKYTLLLVDSSVK